MEVTQQQIRNGEEAGTKVELSAPVKAALATRVEVSLDGVELRYTLALRRGDGPKGGPGWIEEVRGGIADGARRGVSAAEAYVIAELGDAEEEVAAATEEIARALPNLSSRGAGQAARLREEIAAGRARERVVAVGLRHYLERALERGESLGSIASEAGLRTTREEGDVTALKRRLGLEPHTARSGQQTWSQTVAYEEAVAIARAVGADPFEVGV